ncbi:MAG: transporter [Candidatus Omnitrophota bacterium]
MPRRILLLTFVVFVFIISKAPVAAQEAAVAQEEWYPPSVGPLTTWTAPLCSKGEFVIQPFVFYNKTRGTFNSEGHYDSLPGGEKKSQYQQQLFMQYGLTDRLEIDGQVVYQENYIKTSDGKAHDSGFGDSYLFLRYCAVDEGKWMPNITGMLQLLMPTGKYQHLDPDKLGTDSMGSGSWDPGLGVLMTKRAKPFIFHADAVYSFPQRTVIDDVATRYANYLNYDVGVEYFLPKGFNLLLEMNGFLQGDTKEGSDKIPSSNVNYITIVPGVGWSCDKVQLLLAYQRVVAGTNTDANDSVVLTGVYTF